MRKREAIKIFGSPGKTASALGITKQAVNGWPDELSDAVSDRVIGAATRLGKTVPSEFLGKQAA